MVGIPLEVRGEMARVGGGALPSYTHVRHYTDKIDHVAKRKVLSIQTGP